MFAACLLIALVATVLLLAVRISVFLKRHGQTVPVPVRKRRPGWLASPDDELYEMLHQRELEDATLWD